MQKHYFICNKKICINASEFPYDSVYWQTFEAGENAADIDISCIVCDELPKPCGNITAEKDGVSVYNNGDAVCRYAKMGTDEGSVTYYSGSLPIKSETYIVRRNYNVLMDGRYMWNTVAINQLMLLCNVLFFHSSYIEYNGRGLIFSAPCGTGKSTQASLWEKYAGAKIVNGDKAGISLENDGVFVHGLPFCGTSDICNNKTLPLGAIVLLEQAKENTVREVRGFEALQMLMKNIYLDFLAPDEQKKCVDILIEILKKVPVCLLSCTPDERAVAELKKFLCV